MFRKLLLLLIVLLNFNSISNANDKNSAGCSDGSSDKLSWLNCVQLPGILTNYSQDSNDTKNKSKFIKNVKNFIQNKKVLLNDFKDFIKTNGNENKFFKFNDLFSNLDLKSIELRLKQTVYDFVISLNISDHCFQSLLRITEDFKQNKNWALDCMLNM